MKRKIGWLLALVCVVSTLAFALGCAPAGDDDETEKPEFVFSGSTTIAGKTYDVALNAGTDNSFELVVSDYSMTLGGTYEFVSGSGYIFTFADASDTEKKTYYSESKKEFYFYYDLNLGSAVGSNSVRLSLSDADFTLTKKFEYPFEFGYVNNDVLLAGNTVVVTINCTTDGKASAMATCALIAVPTRTGTWAYDATENQYTITLENDTYTSTYDQSTNTYTVTIKLNVGMMVGLKAEYTPFVEE